MVSKNRVGLGKLSNVPLSCPKARPAEIDFRRMFFVSMSAFGGSNGSSLYGVDRSKEVIGIKRRFYARRIYVGKNNDKLLSF